MPGRRYGGFMVGNKYVRASRRHQATDTDAWVEGLSDISFFLFSLFKLAIMIGALIFVVMVLQAFGWPPQH